MEEVKLFYSYSHQDEEYREDIEKSLIMLQRYDSLKDWHFRKLMASEEWNNKIKDELEKADIILLLISRDFLASDYCYDIEVGRAMERHEMGSARVVPIILRDCDWKHANSPFKKLQALPDNATPINEWENKDKAYNSITQGLKELITEIKKKRK